MESSLKSVKSLVKAWDIFHVLFGQPHHVSSGLVVTKLGEARRQQRTVHLDLFHDPLRGTAGPSGRGLRTRKTKGAGSRLACLTMVFKLAMAAQKQWRALNGSQLIAEVIDGVPFVDGVRQKAA